MKYLYIFLITAQILFSYDLSILTEDFEPISYIDNYGNLGGYGVEVVEEIKKELNIDNEIKLLPWVRAYNIGLKEKNVLLFATTYTEERNKNFTFVGPILVGKIRLYSKKTSKDTYEEIKNKSTISVYRDGQEHEILKNLYFKNLEISATPLSAAQKLLFNRADYWANVDLTTQSILVHLDKNLNELYTHEYFIPIKLYLAFSAETNQNIIEEWYEVLSYLKVEGKLEKIFKKYFPNLEFDEKIEIIKRR